MQFQVFMIFVFFLKTIVIDKLLSGHVVITIRAGYPYIRAGIPQMIAKVIHLIINDMTVFARSIVFAIPVQMFPELINCHLLFYNLFDLLTRCVLGMLVATPMWLKNIRKFLLRDSVLQWNQSQTFIFLTLRTASMDRCLSLCPAIWMQLWLFLLKFVGVFKNFMATFQADYCLAIDALLNIEWYHIAEDTFIETWQLVDFLWMSWIR